MHFAEVLIEKAQAIKEKEMNSHLDEDEQFLSSEEVCQMYERAEDESVTGYCRRKRNEDSRIDKQPKSYGV